MSNIPTINETEVTYNEPSKTQRAYNKAIITVKEPLGLKSDP